MYCQHGRSEDDGGLLSCLCLRGGAVGAPAPAGA